jgi:hypothetical protein
MSHNSLHDRLRAALSGRVPGWPLLLLVTGLALDVARYADLTWGNAAPNPDVTRMFRPIAQRVAGGGRLYGPGLADNKPPGWQLLNVAAELTGEYTLAMLLAVGAANGLAAVLLWYWLGGSKLDGDGRAAATAGAVVFLLALPLVGGHHVNSRSLSVAFLLAAFVARRPAVRGLAVAAAALFNAYAGAFVPVLLWLVWHGSGRTRARAMASYLGSGAAVAVAAVTAVGAGWGAAAALAALHWSYGLPLLTGVATSPVHPAAVVPGSYLAEAWLLTYPARWLSYAGTVALQLLPVLALAGLGWRSRGRWSGVVPEARTLAIALAAAALPLLFRAYEQYWLLPLPFLAALAARGLVATVREP